MANIGIIEEKAHPETANAPTAKGTINHVDGISYIPDKIEVAEDKILMSKLGLELLDFVTTLSQLLDLMHLIKARHLRSNVPFPHNVMREVLAFKAKGSLFKSFERKINDMNVNPSVEGILKAQGFQRVARRNAGKKVTEETSKVFPFGNDLVEITGKKVRPTWQTVLLEKPEELNIFPKKTEPDKASRYFQMMPFSRCNVKTGLGRSKSETVLFSIKFVLSEFGDIVKNTDPKMKSQMEMMLASYAGFRTAEEHKAYLATFESHWFTNFLVDALKVGVITCSEHIKAFEMLARHHDMSYNSLPFAKAKLCMVVMSLPFWDISRVPTQRAVEFILEKILLLPEKPLTDWLKARGVPYAVFPTYSVEDFLAQEISQDDVEKPPPDVQVAVKKEGGGSLESSQTDAS